MAGILFCFAAMRRLHPIFHFNFLLVLLSSGRRAGPEDGRKEEGRQDHLHSATDAISIPLLSIRPLHEPRVAHCPADLFVPFRPQVMIVPTVRPVIELRAKSRKFRVVAAR